MITVIHICGIPLLSSPPLGWGEHLLLLPTISLYASAPAVIGQNLLLFLFISSVYHFLMIPFFWLVFCLTPINRAMYLLFKPLFTLRCSLAHPISFVPSLCVQRQRKSVDREEEQNKGEGSVLRAGGKLPHGTELHPLPWSHQSALWEEGQLQPHPRE